MLAILKQRTCADYIVIVLSQDTNTNTAKVQLLNESSTCSRAVPTSDLLPVPSTVPTRLHVVVSSLEHQREWVEPKPRVVKSSAKTAKPRGKPRIKLAEALAMIDSILANTTNAKE